MILLQNERVGCEHCIRGHRAADCIHLGKQLISIKGRGRPAAKDESIRLKIEPNPVIGFTSYELIESKNGKGQSKTRKLCYHLHPETPVSLFKVRLGKGFKIIGPVTSQNNEASLKIHKNQTLNLVSPEQQISMAKLSYAKGDNSIGLATVFEQRLPVTITEDEYPSVLKASQVLFHQYYNSKTTDEKQPFKKKPKISEIIGGVPISTDSTPIFTPDSEQTTDSSISPNGTFINKNRFSSRSGSGSGSGFNIQRAQYYDSIAAQSNLQPIKNAYDEETNDLSYEGYFSSNFNKDLEGNVKQNPTNIKIEGELNLSQYTSSSHYASLYDDIRSPTLAKDKNSTDVNKPQENSQSLISDADLNRLIAEVDSFLPAVDLDFSTDSQWYQDNVESRNVDQSYGLLLSQDFSMTTCTSSSPNSSFFHPFTSPNGSCNPSDFNLKKEFCPKVSNAILGLYSDDVKFGVNQTFEDDVTFDLTGSTPKSFVSKKIQVESSEFSSN